MEPAVPIEKKLQTLRNRIDTCSPLAIAFSGGVDSSLLLKLAHDRLGDRVLALFADSLLQTEAERQGAVAVAREIGARLRVVEFFPLELPDFVANPGDRCYHCKQRVFSLLADLARQEGIAWLADGTNHDDLFQDRPGHRACQELGVLSPLAEAGLDKGEIRQLSRDLGLSTWSRPSASCLATRIPAGTSITAAALTLVERAEAVLLSLGYRGCRVRLMPQGGCVELASGDIEKLVASGDWQRVRTGLLSLGMEKVFLDLLEREGILS